MHVSELRIFVIFYFIFFSLTEIIDSNTHSVESGFNAKN